MEIRLLGPLEVAEHERLLDLGAGKQRALFAILLLHANEVVSNARLIGELWPEAPPRTAPKSVQVYVSGLRKELGDGRLVTRSPGYLLRVDPAELDVARFERLLAEARGTAPEDAAERLRDALALWRGSPLADLAHERFAQPEIARLEGLRLAALEQRIDADLASGRDAELVGELEALVAEHPLRERPLRQLMLALYRCGRQAEALDVYRDARRALVEKLGIEPSSELRSMERAILVQDASLDLDARGAPEPPRAGAVFVGRQRELAELVAALEDALAGRGRLALLAGEPGIGKSRLTEELIAVATARGARVLLGRCWEAGGAPAYWPWTQALRSYLRQVEPEALVEQLGRGAADLARLLPEVRELLPALPAPPAEEPEGTRFRMFEAASSLLHAASRARPLVLVLDDLHAADEPSLLLLQFVARSIPGSRLLVVCAYRDVDPVLQDPLRAALAQLLREPPAAQIALAGLSERDVGEYIELTTGIEPARRLVEAIGTRTVGNPLFLVELVRLLDAEGRIDQVDAHLGIPPGVRAVIGHRVTRLSEQCRGVLPAASVLGREFGLEVMARLCELSAEDLLDVLDEAMAERVVGEVPGSPGRLRFGHALIRDTLYDELTAARRLQLHRQAGEALEAVHAANLQPYLAELAQHFIVAAPAGNAGKAVEYARGAGDRAAAQLAYEEAARLYEMALALVEDAAARCQLLLALGDVRARAGDGPASKRAFREAAGLAEGQGLAEELAGAALGYGGRLIWDKARDDDHLVPLLERALAALGPDDSPLRARLLIRLVCGPLAPARFPSGRKLALSDEALAMARRLGDDATLAYVIDGYIPVNESPANTRDLLELATEQLAVATRAGDKERVLAAHEHRLNRLVELGEMRAAKSELDAMTMLANELRQPTQRWWVAACGARLALLEGRLDDAEDIIAHATSLGSRAGDRNATVTLRLQLYALRREQGRLDEVADVVRRSAEEYPGKPIWRCVEAQMAADLGLDAGARKAFDAVAGDDFAGVPFDDLWLVSMGFLAEAARALDDSAGASVLYRLLLPYADRVAVSYPEISTGSVARYLGLLAQTIGRQDEAARHFESALELNERIGALPWLARTRDDYALLLDAGTRP